MTRGRRLWAVGAGVALAASALAASALAGSAVLVVPSIALTSTPTPTPTPPPQVRASAPTPTPRGAPHPSKAAGLRGRAYPWHLGVVATTFWVGEVFDPAAADGSQRVSTYDSSWFEHYGGCDGVVASGRCETERRTAERDFFPTAMTPRQNPFYLDLPFDDLNDAVGFASRCAMVPWARDPGFAGRCADPTFSYLKNRWVRLIGPGGRTCYGQIEDAGPGEYHDAAYVFGAGDVRPANRRYGGAGLDVSPALNGCLGLAALDGDSDRVGWQLVDDVDVPPGPWRRLVTTSRVLNG